MLVYSFLASAGFLSPWPTYNIWYDLLAEGFRRGHLHLSISPSPELLSKPNPFDPRWRELWAWDCLLYQREFYLYWGPLPAMLQAMARIALGIRKVIGDQYLAFAFVSLSAVGGALLLDRIARRLFLGVPRFIVALALLAFAAANPAPYLVSTPGTYQAAIVGAQAFIMLGLVCAFDGVWYGLQGRKATPMLVAAGTMWALSLACRLSVAPAVGLFIIVTALASSARSARRLHRLAIDLLAVGVPVLVGSVALLAYNKARFNSWFEFGLTYQMETLTLSPSMKNLLPTLYSYFVRPSAVSCHFPFVIQHWYAGLQSMPAWIAVPEGWVEEPIIGMLWAVPTVWLAPVAVGSLARQSLPGSVVAFSQGATQRIAKSWLVWSLLVGAVFAGAADFVLRASTMRYLADFTGPWVLLGILGSLTIAMGPRRWLRYGGRVVAGGLAVATVVIGLLLGFQGYNNQFERSNPWLYEKAIAKLSMCK